MVVKPVIRLSFLMCYVPVFIDLSAGISATGNPFNHTQLPTDEPVECGSK